jgi:hypothetical protein
MSIIASLSAVSYGNWQKDVQAINARDELRATLVRAQQLSTAVAMDDQWGVHLEEDRIVLFKGSFYNQSEPENIEHELQGVNILDPTNSFTDGAGGRQEDVLFYKFTGMTANTGTVSIYPISEPAAVKTLDVLATGHVE